MQTSPAFSTPTRLLFAALLGCCAVFFACGLFPERFALERPELTDLSSLQEADAANEGKLVFACEKMQEPLMLADKPFGFSSSGLMLTRRVLYYQWAPAERSHLSSPPSAHGSVERRWVPAPLPSTQSAHNEIALPMLPDIEAQPTPVLNGLPLAAELVTPQGEAALASLEQYRIPAELAARSSIVGGNTLYVRRHPGSDPQQPEVGDMMIQWLVHPMPAMLSVVATQRNGRLVCADKPTGYPNELFELQSTDRSFSAANAELNKRGDAAERAAMGAVSLLVFILAYLLRPAMAQGFSRLCGAEEEAPKPGCIVTLAGAVVLMIISYQAGRLFIAPQEAWPYVVLPAATAYALILRQRGRNREQAEMRGAEEAPYRTDAFAETFAEQRDLPQPIEEAAEPDIEEEEPIPHPPAPRRKRGGCATVAGLVLLILGGSILVWGEGYNADLSRSLDDVGRRVLTLDAASAPRPETEGEPVCVSGVVETPEILHDQTFGVAVNGVRLMRHAAVRQWVQEVYQRETRRRRRHNSDDDTYLRYEYSYSQIWSAEYINSADFHIRAGHHNMQPLAPELTACSLIATRVHLGAYTLSDSAVWRLEGDEELPLAEDYRPLPNLAPYNPRRTADGYLELRRDPTSPPDTPAANGDRRFRWSYLPSGRSFTVLGAQQGGSLVPWRAEGQEPLLLVRPGTWSAEEMLGMAEDDRFYTALGMRVCYICMLLGGLFLLFKHSLTRRLFRE